MRKLSANISTCWNSRFQLSGLSARLPPSPTLLQPPSCALPPPALLVLNDPGIPGGGEEHP